MQTLAPAGRAFAQARSHAASSAGALVRSAPAALASAASSAPSSSGPETGKVSEPPGDVRAVWMRRAQSAVGRSPHLAGMSIATTLAPHSRSFEKGPIALPAPIMTKCASRRGAAPPAPNASTVHEMALAASASMMPRSAHDTA